MMVQVPLPVQPILVVFVVGLTLVDFDVVMFVVGLTLVGFNVVMFVVGLTLVKSRVSLCLWVCGGTQGTTAAAQTRLPMVQISTEMERRLNCL